MPLFTIGHGFAANFKLLSKDLARNYDNYLIGICRYIFSFNIA